jgi:hypothetical protein
LPSPKKTNRNVGAIVGDIIGGIAAIFAVIGIVTFVQRRRKWRRSKPGSILSTDSVDAGPQMIVSPFDPNSFDANQDSGLSAEQQPLVIGEPEPEMVALHRVSSSPPAVLPLLRPVAPVPVGLSDKEIARLRAEALRSPQPPNFPVPALNMSQSTSPLNAVTESRESPYDTRRVPVGLSGKEVARLRAEALRSPQPHNFPALALNTSQPTSSLNAVTESRESSYDTRRLRSEFESLRREVERLRAEGLVVTAPPSYAE